MLWVNINAVCIKCGLVSALQRRKHYTHIFEATIHGRDGEKRVGEGDQEALQIMNNCLCNYVCVYIYITNCSLAQVEDKSGDAVWIRVERDEEDDEGISESYWFTCVCTLKLCRT